MQNNIKKLLFLFILLLTGFQAFADTAALNVPGNKTASPFPFALSMNVEHTENPKEIAKGIQIIAFLTILSVAPAILIMTTSFTRITVILAFLKRASGVGTQPSQQIVVGLALFLTVYIMAPVGVEMNEKAIKPYVAGTINQADAFKELLKPLRKFMFKYTREKDIALFIHLAKMEKPATKDDVPTHLLIPAYIISELKTAFQVGFVLFLPFLIIDMVVASILLSMGMIVLPPVTISTPFKILLFVMVDGWHLVIRSIAMGFGS